MVSLSWLCMKCETQFILKLMDRRTRDNSFSYTTIYNIIYIFGASSTSSSLIVHFHDQICIKHRHTSNSINSKNSKQLSDLKTIADDRKSHGIISFCAQEKKKHRTTICMESQNVRKTCYSPCNTKLRTKTNAIATITLHIILRERCDLINGPI